MDRRAGAEIGGAVGELTQYFRSLVTALGDEPGWYGVFAARDPQGVQAYLDGMDVPPWDVLLAVLHDVGARRGGPVPGAALNRVEALYVAAVAEFDAAPGAESALRRRLDEMQRERQYATVRERDIARAVRLGTADPNDLAWARDDRERATARCVELQGRLDALEARPPAPDDWFLEPQPGAGWEEPPAAAAPAPASVPAPRAEEPPAPVAERRPAGRTKRERPRGGARYGGARYGGARFAGAPEAEPEPAMELPVAPTEPTTGDGPRGARFAGAPEAPSNRKEARREAEARELQAHRVAAQEMAARLGELRRTGRSGEVYVLMSEAAAAPAEQVPMLAAALERSGLAADVQTLLWELAAQTPPLLAAAAAALAAAGRPDDCRTLLNQAAARSAPEVALTAAALCDAGHRSEAVTLLAALVRTRTPEIAAEIVYARHDLAGPVLDAAGLHSVSRRRDVAAALRRAGLPDRET